MATIGQSAFGANAGPTPFIISGLKAAQPGGLGITQTNTLPAKQTASPINQVATGNSSNTAASATNNGQPVSGAPGSVINGGGITQANTQPNLPVPPATTNYTTPSGTIVNSNGGTVSTPANTFGGTVGQLIGTANNNAAIGNNASSIASNYGQQIAQVGQEGALGQTGVLTGGLTSPVAQGRAAVIGQNTSAQESALAAGESAALQGTQQQLTAQGQTQSGLTSAASLTQPSSAGYPFVFNPATGGFTSATGGNLDPQTAAQQLAQGVINGTVPYSTAVQTMGYLPNGVGQTYLTQAIQAAGGNITALQAQAAAQQQSIETLGTAQANADAQNINTTTTAATNASNTAYNTAVQNVAKNTATYQALTGVSDNLNSTLANWTQNGQLTALNQGINTVAGLTSNPQYQQFVTALGNAQASYQAALGASGVTPTKADQDAVAALSPNSSATAINAALNQLSADAHALLIVPAYNQQQTYAQQLGLK